MKTIEDRIAEQEARQAISELRARYAWYGLRCEGEKVASLFTEECFFEVPAAPGSPRKALRSRAELREFLGRSRPALGSILPLVHNEITSIRGNEAEGSCVLHRPATSGATAMAGRYLERFKRIDGTWFFSERRLFRAIPDWEDEHG